VKRTPSTTRRAGNSTLATGIDVLPFASRICPAGPVAVVVVVVEDVDGVVVEVVELVVVELVELVLDVESVELVLEVESVVLDVDVESAAGASGPALPALAK
jgi:hypothetical protein